MNTSIPTLLQRAEQLVQVKRFAEAAAMLRQVLANDPDNAVAHAFLAFCLVETQQLQDATRHAEQAVAAAPELALAHLALANALRSRQRFPEARLAIDVALRLEPEDPDLHAMKAQICFNERDWRGAREAAEQGLRLDPRDETCANLRAMALRQLRQGKVAEQTIRETLARDPENSDSHANLGWTLLEQRKVDEALKHFQEALRLESESEFAKVGLINALQSRYFVYRWMFQYFTWISKFATKYAWAIVLGGYFGYRILIQLGEQVPALRPITLPLAVAYVIFALTTWLVTPLTNLALLSSRYGRTALGREEKWTAGLVAVCLVAGTLLLLLALMFQAIPRPTILVAIMIVALSIPISGVTRCEIGWPRRWALGLVGALGSLIVATAALIVTGSLLPPEKLKLNFPTDAAYQQATEKVKGITDSQQQAIAMVRVAAAMADDLATKRRSRDHQLIAWEFRLFNWFAVGMLVSQLALNWLALRTVRL